MPTFYLGLGSNLGDRAGALRRAIERLGELGRVTGVSGVFETDPVGYTEQPDFLNLVVRLETPLGPEALAEATRSIERDLGRVRTFRNAPRPLDIDLLLVDPGEVGEGIPATGVVDRPGLRIPHPRMTERAFVLVPLLELAPAAADPAGRPYAEHLADLGAGAGGGTGVRRVMDGEELMHGGE